jgi:hypothetical protein
MEVSSEVLYAWYKATGYKTKYNDFCTRVIIKLPNTEFKDLTPYSNLSMD